MKRWAGKARRCGKRQRAGLSLRGCFGTRLLLLLLLALGVAGRVEAQAQTAVSGTITDPNGLPYSNASVQAVLVTSGGQVPSVTPCTNSAGCQITGPSPAATTDVNGKFALSLWPNASILPASSTYTFNVSISPGSLPPVGTGPQSFTVTGITIAGSSQSLSALLSGAALALSHIAGGGGGGSAPCTITANSVQFGNTPTSLGCAQEVDLGAPGGVATAGISPNVNVRYYGATGDGATDDTTAIQAGINFACAHGSATLYFPPPPNFYKVSQPQSGTSPVFNTSACSALLILGGNSGNQRVQFGAPAVTIKTTAGATPNPAPIFNLAAVNSAGLENIELDGYNEALVCGSNCRMFNVNLQTGPTGIGTALQPNAPFVYGGSIWLDWIGGTANSNSTTLPSIIILNNNSSQSPGILHFTDLTNIGHIEARSVVNQGPEAGGWHFTNVSMEESSNGFLVIDDDGTHPWASIKNITIEYGGISDATYTFFAKLNSGANTSIQGFHLSDIELNGSATAVVGICAGSITQLVADGLSAPPVATDCSGNVLGPSTTSNAGGFDYVSGGTETQRTDLAFAHAIGGGAVRGFNSGGSQVGSFATTSMDPAIGWCVGESTTYGPEGCVYNDGLGTIDFKFPSAYAPTGVTGTPTTGGTVAAGTYFYWVISNTSGSCSTLSAPSLASAPVVVSGANNAVTVNWTLPAVAGSGTITGFCILRSQTGPQWDIFNQRYSVFVSGASTTTYTDVGTMGCCSTALPAPGAWAAVHRFTPTAYYPATNGIVSLGIPGFAFTNVWLTALNNFGIPYQGGSGPPLSSTASPMIPGQYGCGYFPTTTTPVAPTCPQFGLNTSHNISGSATTDLVLFSDNLAKITHIHSATGAVNQTLPTATTLNNPQFAYSYCNNSPQTDTITPTTWTIQAGNNAAAASLSVAPGTCYRVSVDPSSSTNWLADGSSNNTGTTITVASGTAVLATAAIASAACATAITVSATGTLSTDVVTWTPNTSIKAVTGYTPSTGGGLSIVAYPTANNVNFDVCNWSNASITPGAVTLNWRVVR
jgi:hypothetical protein